MRKKISRIHASTSPELLEFNIHPLLKQIYANRGIQDIALLEKGFSQLLSYRDLLNIDQAVDRLYIALKKQQRILIIGDYDVDGATSTALLVKIFRAFGAAHVEFLLPNRFTYGYGFSPKIVGLASEGQPDLIITVDNGISSVEAIDAANALGIDVIVTDHHLAPPVLPNAIAIINPNQPNDRFQSKNLAGVGVAFYVSLALRTKLREENWFEQQAIKEPNLASFLDLVALGTIADVVSLDQNNRILVYQGMQRIRQGKCCAGISALINISKRRQSALVTSDLAYALSPRLNAAGRLDDMSLGVRCLLAEDMVTARKIALELDALNDERRVIEQEMRLDAIIELEKIHLGKQQGLPKGLCLMNENWHQGIIGILASRLKDQLQRPVIVFAPHGDDQLKGSARSVSGVHLKNVLEGIAVSHPGLIMNYGGHAMAAGLNLARSCYNEFKQVFDECVSHYLSESDFQEELMSDGELDVQYLSVDIAKMLKESEPWGEGFNAPLFDGKFRVIDQRIVGRRHLKLDLEYQEKIIEAIVFNIDTDRWPNYGCEQVNMAYHLDINEYRGERKLQLLVDYIEAV